MLRRTIFSFIFYLYWTHVYNRQRKYIKHVLNEEFVFFRFTDSEPYRYSTYGATCSTVEIDVLTGEMHVLRSDIMYDCGERSVHVYALYVFINCD